MNKESLFRKALLALGHNSADEGRIHAELYETVYPPRPLTEMELTVLAAKADAIANTPPKRHYPANYTRFVRHHKVQVRKR